MDALFGISPPRPAELHVTSWQAEAASADPRQGCAVCRYDVSACAACSAERAAEACAAAPRTTRRRAREEGIEVAPVRDPFFERQYERLGRPYPVGRAMAAAAAAGGEDEDDDGDGDLAEEEDEPEDDGDEAEEEEEEEEEEEPASPLDVADAGRATRMRYRQAGVKPPEVPVSPFWEGAYARSNKPLPPRPKSKSVRWKAPRFVPGRRAAGGGVAKKRVRHPQPQPRPQPAEDEEEDEEAAEEGEGDGGEEQEGEEEGGGRRGGRGGGGGGYAGAGWRARDAPRCAGAPGG